MKAFLRLSLRVALLSAVCFAADRDPSVLMQADRDFAKAMMAELPLCAGSQPVSDRRHRPDGRALCTLEVAEREIATAAR